MKKSKVSTKAKAKATSSKKKNPKVSAKKKSGGVKVKPESIDSVYTPSRDSKEVEIKKVDNGYIVSSHTHNKDGYKGKTYIAKTKAEAKAKATKLL